MRINYLSNLRYSNLLVHNNLPVQLQFEMILLLKFPSHSKQLSFVFTQVLHFFHANYIKKRRNNSHVNFNQFFLFI